MEYEKLCPEEIMEVFENITRQRISQILQKYEQKNDKTTVDNIKKAKLLLKKKKLAAKPKRIPTREQLLRKKAKSLWDSMLRRCEFEDSYSDVIIGGCFTVFEDFFKWCKTQKGFGEPYFEIDKDILIKGNRTYSEDTCVFVPKRLNMLLIRCKRTSPKKNGLPIGVYLNSAVKKYVAQLNVDGELVVLGYFDTPDEAFSAYKKAKEDNIKRMAGLYKDQIEPRAYDALMSWAVELAD